MVEAVLAILVDFRLPPVEGGFGLGVVTAFATLRVGLGTGGRAPLVSSGESDSLYVTVLRDRVDLVEVVGAGEVDLGFASFFKGGIDFLGRRDDDPLSTGTVAGSDPLH